ncbi:hypothetical protein C8R46DRAFT_1244694 [Mycena filopes]|nr:hypothetical protein C8R46DRAFT_1244694 [Mycena filopes]
MDTRHQPCGWCRQPSVPPPVCTPHSTNGNREDEPGQGRQGREGNLEAGASSNRALLDHRRTLQPPAQFKKLETARRKARVEPEPGAESGTHRVFGDHCSTNESSEEEDVPNGTPERETKPGLLQTPQKASGVVQVNFFDKHNHTIALRQVVVNNFPVSILTADDGSKRVSALLSELIPAAIKNDSPIKERGGRMYHPNICDNPAHHHIGKVEALVAGTIFFPRDLPLSKALYLLGFFVSLYPLLQLHLNQQWQLHQLACSAWVQSIQSLLTAAFQREDPYPPIWATETDSSAEYAEYISDDLGPLYGMLGLTPDDLRAPTPEPLFPCPRVILRTPRLSCVFCPVADLNIIPTLQCREKLSKVWVLDVSSRWVEADLIVAHCASCHADHYPDRITYLPG